MKILLLNVSYEPLKLITLEEAICKVYSEDVFLEGEMLFSVAGGTNCNGERSILALSHVLRNKTYDKSSKSNVPFSRQLMFMRDSFSCIYCHKKGTKHDLTYDHVIPKAILKNKGLLNQLPYDKKNLVNKKFIYSWENAVTSCKKCNSKKGSSVNVYPLHNPKAPSLADSLYLKSTQDQRKEFFEYIQPFLKVIEAPMPV